MAAKKKRKKKTKAEALRDDLKATAQKVWLAGLGALSVAEEEGSRVFKKLVDKGEEFEKRSRPRVDKLKAAAGDAADTARERVEKLAESMEETAGKVGDVVDEKVTSALHKFGVPTKREIDELNATVAALTEKLAGMQGVEKTTKRKPAKRKATKRKPAKRKATKRKPAKRKAAKKTARKKTTRKPAARKKATKRATRKATKKTMG